MSSLYTQSVPVLIKYLKNLSGLLRKGAEFADKNGISHDELLSFRLAPDMKGYAGPALFDEMGMSNIMNADADRTARLPYQVQSCCNTAKFLATRVGGMENIVIEDNETTFDELQARITRTTEILNSLDPSCMDGKANAEVIVEYPTWGRFRFTGQSYVSEFAIPNFHFHLTSAYCILRHRGVEIGAFDYLNDVFHKIT